MSATYMAFSDDANAIAGWDTEAAAREWITTTIDREPDSAAAFYVIEFDANGMAQRLIYPEAKRDSNDPGGET